MAQTNQYSGPVFLGPTQLGWDDPSGVSFIQVGNSVVSYDQSGNIINTDAWGAITSVCDAPSQTDQTQLVRDAYRAYFAARSQAVDDFRVGTNHANEWRSRGRENASDVWNGRDALGLPGPPQNSIDFGLMAIDGTVRILGGYPLSDLNFYVEYSRAEQTMNNALANAERQLAADLYRITGY